MQFTLATALAIAAFVPSISAHIIMATPKQWFVPTFVSTPELSDGQQNPLKADGSNFPCHGVPPENSVATYQPGSTQTLQLLGTAVHGGGSGQMSITYDSRPTRDSRWGVMTSWQGNHPIQHSGNIEPGNAQNPLPPLSFRVPANLPAGRAVVAWTWFNRIGNREMYMQCATITIGGSVTSRDAFNALPTMFRANTNNGCGVPEGVQSIKFKNPGPQVFGTGVTTIACDSTQPGNGGGGNPPPPPPPPSGTTRSTSFTSLTTRFRRSIASAVPGSCAEGTITCDSSDTWSICTRGRTVSMGAVASGTKCSGGQIKRN